MQRHAARLALAALLACGVASVGACEDETFEKPPDYDLSKPIRDLSGTAPPPHDLSVTPSADLAKRDLAPTLLDLRLPLPDTL
jgi:hypothetical protein